MHLIRVGRMPRDRTERQQFDNKLMRVKHLLKHFSRLPLYGLAAWALACPLSAHATTTNVNVTDVGNNNGAYVPDSVAINVGDQVTWNWKGTLDHTVTSRTSVWPSMDGGNGFKFSFTFTNAGRYGYYCLWHGFTGLVAVATAIVPPSVAITAPTNGATFAAPWTGTIQATVSDTNDTVSKVDF